MSYLVLAYPELEIKDFELIQSFRKENDKQYFNVVEPHFTIVFPVFDIGQDEFILESKVKSKGFQRFDFVIRCATITKDSFSDNFYILLVPDEGYSKIVRLHDKLYSGIFKDNHRLDIDFIPHIAIGGTRDKFICKKMVDDWNAKDFSISGKVSKLTIVKYANDFVTTIDDFELD